MEEQTSLRFDKKYLNLCFEDEWTSSGLERQGGKITTEYSLLGELILQKTAFKFSFIFI